MTVAWEANAEADLQGYRVYFGTASGAYVQGRGNGLNAGLATELPVIGLQRGTTYFFAVTSYDRNGNESGFSSEASGAVQ